MKTYNTVSLEVFMDDNTECESALLDGMSQISIYHMQQGYVEFRRFRVSG